eukprot:6206027-Pleurochrysis_carterae.AAC.4
MYVRSCTSGADRQGSGRWRDGVDGAPRQDLCTQLIESPVAVQGEGRPVAGRIARQFEYAARAAELTTVAVFGAELANG